MTTTSAWSREGGTVRFALGLAVPLAAALLQGTVAPLVAVAGARPLLPILAAGSWAVAAGATEAVWWAFIAGLATDLLSGGPLGAFALAFLPPVAAIGVRDGGHGRSTPVVAAAALVALAAFAAGMLYLGVVAATGQGIPSVPLAIGSAAVAAVYTGVLAFAVYPLARMVRRVTEKQGALGVW
jgi:rod shape-determining protein MreD